MPDQQASPLAPGHFPHGFTWGTATASYQIEGAVYADGRGESIWDRFSHTPGKVVNGDTGDIACDHYHRWMQDIDLMREIGAGAYRFSVAWPRVVPGGRGPANEAGLAFYDRLVDGLLAAGITPWVTLYHWDLPQVLEDAGGWPNRATADAFAEYVDIVTRRLGDRVKHWITLNEPWCSAYLGYANGVHAPGKQDWRLYLPAVHGLLLAHGKAVGIIRRNVTDSRVGITLNLSQAYPTSVSEADRDATRRHDGDRNRWYLDPLYGRGYPEDMQTLYGDAVPATEAADFDLIAAKTDFLGLNYYSPTFVRDNPGAGTLAIGTVQPADGEYTQMDWLIYPDGLYDQLARVSKDYPVGELYITENGAAYPDDPPKNAIVADSERTRYYFRHLAAAQRAVAAGLPLAGYFAWSLMDNFEWAFGYTRRFGITYVDFDTQQRTIKQSGRYYSSVVRQNRLVDGEAVQPGDAEC